MLLRYDSKRVKPRAFSIVLVSFSSIRELAETLLGPAMFLIFSCCYCFVVVCLLFLLWLFVCFGRLVKKGSRDLECLDEAILVLVMILAKCLRGVETVLGLNHIVFLARRYIEKWL